MLHSRSSYRNTISPLYRTCLRIVVRNLNYCHSKYHLSALPWTIKKDLIYLTMKSFIGFQNEDIFINLLTPDVKILMFESSILTDSMLETIANRCKNLRKLLIPADGQYHFTQNGLCNSINLMKNLLILQIDGCEEVDDHVIDVISTNCKQLKCLYVNDCANITDSCVTSLKTMELIELNLANTKVTDNLLLNLKDSELMNNLKDICLKNCSVTKSGLGCLKWDILENINIIGTYIDDLSFIPSTAVYKTLNWSI